MSGRWIQAPGDQVSPRDLRVDKALQMASVLQEGCLPFVDFVECRKSSDDSSEVIVFDVDVERGQKSVKDIRRRERIAIVFDANDSHMPDVLALREDFPRDLPHLNLRPAGQPRSLCLYDAPYDEVRMRWSPAYCVETIRQWLSLTAMGVLHADDQLLEPLVWSGARTLIVPLQVLAADARFVSVSELLKKGYHEVYRAQEVDPATLSPGNHTTIAMVAKGKPQVHGILQASPTTLHELAAFLQKAQLDLIADLRHNLKTWYELRPEIINCGLVIIADLPKVRNEGTKEESFDLWAFDTASSVRDVGIDLGVWASVPNSKDVGLLLEVDQTTLGRNIPVRIMNVAVALTPALASVLNGVQPTSRKLVCVGVGALGSQIVNNLLRAGFGRWTLVDHDHLFPHNLARHALHGPSQGHPKATSLAKQLNELFTSERPVEALATDVLHPGSATEELNNALQSCDVIVDVSTSVAVARELAIGVTSPARRISFFLTPSGGDLVMLAEDAERNVQLDLLEMQYYRFLAGAAGWEDHLRPPEGRRRYANSCRDVSSIISQELVALHAAVASRNLRRVVDTESCEISIWRANPVDMSVTVHHIELSKPLSFHGKWSIITDQHFLDKVYSMREERLPNETGGVLIGSVDLSRKIIYVVDFVPSPPDSQEWPTVYIRGCEGLPDAVAQVERRTAGMLQYIGEWHSHPKGYSARPSEDDLRAFTWLREIMIPVGIPPIMLIAGDDFRFYVDTESHQI